MKMKKILITLLIVGMLTCGLTAVFAEDGTLDDGTKFTIPEGYTVLKSEDGILTLTTDDQSHVVTVSNVNIGSAEDGKQAQIDGGAEFQTEATKTINGVEVTEQNFVKNGLNLHAYLYKVGDVNFLTTAVNTDSEWNVEDTSNPVNVIITSLTGSTEESSE